MKYPPIRINRFISKKQANTALLFFLFFLAIQGCGGVSNISKNFFIQPAKGTGVAVVYLSQTGIKYGTAMFLKLRLIGGDFDKEVSVFDIGSSEYWMGKASERLAAFELPQGNYEFYSWVASAKGWGNDIANVQAPHEFSKKFQIISGKAVYLGNLHIEIKSFPFADESFVEGFLYFFLRQYISIDIKDLMGDIKEHIKNAPAFLPISYSVVIKDERERDIPQFLRMHSNIKQENVIIDIIK